MKKTLSMLFALAFLATPILGIASADETHPDCEADQPGLGWESVPNSQYHQTCEGEHWDGQDYYTKDDSSTNGGGALPCTGATDRPSYKVVSVNQCADPAATEKYVGARVSTGDSDRGTFVYAMINIMAVGETGAFADAGDGASATWYGKDHTLIDALASAVSAARLTRGEAGDKDCTYEEYKDAAGWESGEHNVDDESPQSCERDNTAISVVLLP